MSDNRTSPCWPASIRLEIDQSILRCGDYGCPRDQQWSLGIKPLFTTNDLNGWYNVARSEGALRVSRLATGLASENDESSRNLVYDRLNKIESDLSSYHGTQIASNRYGHIKFCFKSWGHSWRSSWQDTILRRMLHALRIYPYQTCKHRPVSIWCKHSFTSSLYWRLVGYLEQWWFSGVHIELWFFIHDLLWLWEDWTAIHSTQTASQESRQLHLSQGLNTADYHG